ncbi:hypothetical protein [Rhizobium leguminosarum]|uniref:hypothetical protein n=1 Tax=Rhizobium leguminosarum TaxID=384 RepID=UPI002FF3A8FF
MELPRLALRPLKGVASHVSTRPTAELAEISNMAIAKLADPHRRPTTATTSNYPLRHMAILPSALSHPLYHSKLRSRPQELRKEGQSISLGQTSRSMQLGLIGRQIGSPHVPLLSSFP